MTMANCVLLLAEPEIEPLFDESGQPKKIGAKKMRKLQEKAERRAQREVMYLKKEVVC